MTLSQPQRQGLSDQSSPFPEESDADLLGYMALAGEAEDDQALARAAWSEFYMRHARYLYGTLINRGFVQSLNGPQRVEELVQDTFLRAFQKAGTFRPPLNAEGKALTRAVRGWIGEIALNIYRDDQRKRENSPEIQPLHEVSRIVSTSEASTGTPAKLVALRQAWETLSEKQQTVLRVTFFHNKPGEKYQRVPTGEATRLARDLDTTTENVRVIRSRGLKKLKEGLRNLGLEVP